MVNIFSLVRKIFIIGVKTCLVIFIFYLFLACVVVPVGAPWVISSQGTKFLKHPVKARSVFFNPFLLRLSVNGFEITDSNKQAIAGFDKFWIDLSFIRLFKKELRVETLGVDAPRINAVLLPDGRINLLELVPLQPAARQTAAAEQASKEKQAKVQPLTAKPLPLVIVDSFVLRQGSVSFVDQSVVPNFKTALNKMDLSITGLSTKPDAQVKTVFQCALDEKGSISTEVLFKPFVQPLNLESAFSLNNYSLQVLTPYVGKYTGREVKDGKLNLKMDYRVADNQLKASHKILVQRFNFGAKVPSKDALNLPFGLAVGLLEDPQGRINISLPVTGDMNDPKFEYFHLIGQVARNFFMRIVTKPLMFLLSLAGSETGTEETEFVRFMPGKTDLTVDNQERLQALVKVLKERPKLLLEINGSYDSQADWQAIRLEIFENKYQAQLKESTRTGSRLIEPMYVESFGIRSYWNLAKKYKLSSGKDDDAKLAAEMKRRLIEDAPKDQASLDTLAKARARLVYDFIITEGFDKARVSIGVNRQAQISMGYVPLEFNMTVFEELP